MSADNGIYVAEFPDGYRVCYGSCIENVFYWPEGTPEYKNCLREYFCNSPVFPLEHMAASYAWAKYKELDYQTEYGVAYLGKFGSFI